MNSKPPILERAKIAINVFRHGFPQRQSTYGEKQKIPFLWPDWRLGKPTYHEIDMRSYIDDGFNINSLVYSAVMYKGRSSIIPRLRAYEGDPENPKLCNPDHPLSKLIARPNSNQSWSEFQLLRTIYFNLTGDSFAYLHKPIKDSFEGASYYVLRSDRTYIVVSKKDSTFMGYLYVPEGKPYSDGVPLLPEFVSHVKLPNPADPLEGNGYGLSPLVPAHRTKEVDNAITDFIKIFFEKGAVVPGLLTSDISLSDEEVAITKERWNEIYSGYKNWTDVGVIDKGTTYQRMGMDFKEMSFAEQDERNETRILGPFGVPISLLDTRAGLKASTFNNKENDRRMFWEDIMLPEIGLFEDDYQYYLADGKAFVKMDYSTVPALKRDIPKAVEAAYKLWTMGETRSNAYAIVGIDPVGKVPGADTSFLPISVMPVGSESESVAPDNDGAASSQDEDREEPAKAKTRRKEKK